MSEENREKDLVIPNEQDIVLEMQRSVREKELKEAKVFDEDIKTLKIKTVYKDIKFLKNMNIIHIIIEGLLFLVSYILYERMKYV